MKEASEIQVGVVGYGGAYNMGKQHLEEMAAAGMTPVAVAEIDPVRLAIAEKDFSGVTGYSSMEEMLEKSPVDLVVIITPHNTHATLTEQCLEAGRHVVCEKPLAITTAEVDSMIATAQRNERMLSTYHNRHWDGCILEAMQRIHKEGVIGDIVGITAHMLNFGDPGEWWRASKSISGGILYDWGVHLLEYAFQLIDSEVVEVTGFSHNGFWARQNHWKEDTVEDDAFAMIRFKSGQRLVLQMSNIHAAASRNLMEIQGTGGVYTFDIQSFSLTRKVGEVETVTRQPNRPGEWHRYYQNVAAHLTGREPLIIDGFWSRRPIHIIDLAVRSAREGRALPAFDHLHLIQK